MQQGPRSSVQGEGLPSLVNGGAVWEGMIACAIDRVCAMGEGNSWLASLWAPLHARRLIIAARTCYLNASYMPAQCSHPVLHTCTP
eukprot:1160395-Pelagomonas_calceolata.AAC.3